MRVTLLSDAGFEWVSGDNVFVKGYFFFDNVLYVGNSAVEYFSNTEDLDDFRGRVCDLNGSFAVVVRNNDGVLAAVDRLRSIPLFYSANGGAIISDSGTAVRQEAATAKIDETALEDFQLVGYVIGNRTLVEGVRQLQAGELLFRSPSTCHTETYYRHNHDELKHAEERTRFDTLDEITERVFTRLLRSCAGRKIAIPLSGGYDSRYIAAALKKLGATNVVCFTYGKKGSFEVSISRQVAERLGFEWHFVEYTDQKWRDCIDDKDFVEYASNLTSLPNIQDYIALKELSQQGVLPKSVVVVPGYCGDLLGGSYVPYELLIDRPGRLLQEGLPAYISRTQFGADQEAGQNAAIMSRIQDEIFPDSPVVEVEDFVGRNEEFFTRHKVAKYVVNAVRSIEYFGFEWRMPLWDNELAEYFYRIPVAERMDSTMYDRYLNERVFGPFDIGYQKKPENSFKRAFKKRCPDFLYDGVEGSYQIAMKFLRRAETVDINRFSGFVGLCLEDMNLDEPIDRPDIISVYAAWYLECFLRKTVAPTQ